MSDRVYTAAGDIPSLRQQFHTALDRMKMNSYDAIRNMSKSLFDLCKTDESFSSLTTRARNLKNDILQHDREAKDIEQLLSKMDIFAKFYNEEDWIKKHGSSKGWAVFMRHLVFEDRGKVELKIATRALETVTKLEELKKDMNKMGKIDELNDVVNGSCSPGKDESEDANN
ncbi:hypothetical protein GQ44DRAFT_727358 [Phaeosphaeriaceae sp. PMI808]|nr:hypothetical protein GQ44DRAFT_727358 [Phaeosphaeriaceae sp. PMI808]